MPEPSGHDEHEARMQEALRRAQELEQDRTRIHDRLVNTAEAVRQSHEQVARMMDDLAESGAAEHASRRREMAERSRALAEKEAQHIAALTDPAFGGQDDDPDQGPDTNGTAQS